MFRGIFRRRKGNYRRKKYKLFYPDYFMSLTIYKQKRNLKKSGEPESKEISKKNLKNIFVVHEHHASHLHWDLRLEMNRVLKSWAVPKEPPTAKSEKRLAIQVEDHPLSYAKFEGEIPGGNYGAGKVKIWDEGKYELIKKTATEIELNFDGKKLKGKYVLIKTHYGSKPEKSWLFMKV